MGGGKNADEGGSVLVEGENVRFGEVLNGHDN